MPAGYGGVDIQITGVEWARAAAAIKSLDREIFRDLSREIGRIAKPMVDDMREAVQATSSSASGGGSISSATASRAAFTLSRSRGALTVRKFTGIVGRSGLRAAVARSVQVQRRTSGSTAGVRIKANPGSMPADQRKLPAYMDEGRWRHPVLGNRSAWVTQTVSPSGWFTDTAAKSGGKVRGEIMEVTAAAVAEVARKLDAAG